MRTFQQISAIRALVHAARADGKTVGLVPTMGSFHEGHLSLMRRARSDCDVVVVSLFVNPTQFAPGEDYERYPRDLARDSRRAQEAGVDALFAPSPAEMYPDGFSTSVRAADVARAWEGEARPGHFDGVATVCAKLFQIVQPDRAYFGQKDYQQLRVIERLVADLNIPVSVVPVATVREGDGLAMSSRNAYLSKDERKAAVVLHRALEAAQGMYAAGERSAEALRQAMEQELATEGAAHPDYVGVADADTLAPLTEVDGRAVLLLAVRVGATRLIDNAVLGPGAARRAESAPSKG